MPSDTLRAEPLSFSSRPGLRALTCRIVARNLDFIPFVLHHWHQILSIFTLMGAQLHNSLQLMAHGCAWMLDAIVVRNMEYDWMAAPQPGAGNLMGWLVHGRVDHELLAAVHNVK